MEKIAGMKVALINPPYEHLVLRCGYCSTFSKSDYYWPPLDLIIQSGFMDRAGHGVKIFDFNIEGTGREEALEEVVSYAPDGVFMLVGSGSWKSDVAFAGKLKERLPDIRLVVSGGPPLYNPEQFLRQFPALDAVLMDFTQDVVRGFLAGEEGLPHLSYRRDGGMVVGIPNTEKEFSYPTGRHDLLPLDLYRNPWRTGRFTVTLTSFGCPFSCTFCNTTGVPFKYRPLEEIVQELKVIRSVGIKEIMFRDLNFVSNRKRTRELMQRMIDDGIGLNWYACARADMLDDETLGLMKRAGCHTLHIGVESGSDEILKHYHKSVDLPRIEEAFKLCRKHGIKTLAFFIIGLPGETPASILKTIEFAKKIRCDFASFNIASPLYGSMLRNECIEKGYITSPEGLEELETSYQEISIETPYITKEQLHEGHRLAVRSFYLRPGYLLGRLFSIRGIADIRVLWRMGIPVLKGILKGG